MSDITMLDRTRIINSMEKMVDRIELDKLVARLTAENAELRSKLARYESVCGQDLVAECAELNRVKSSLTIELDALEDERNELRAKLEQAEAKVHRFREALRNVTECAQVVLDNAHWEVRHGSGDLERAIIMAKQALSETGGEK